MKITFQFNPKSSGQNVPIALSIAEKCGGTIESNLCQIDFDSIEDKNFRKLCNLVGNLKDSQISIDDREPVNAKIFLHIANCPYKHLCKENIDQVQSNFHHIDEYDFDVEELNEEYIDELLEADVPLGYICKKIRFEDCEVVDIFYKSFEEMVKIWEEADFLRDDYVINTIKPLYYKDETLLYRTVKRYEEKYNL